MLFVNNNNDDYYSFTVKDERMCKMWERIYIRRMKKLIQR